MYHYRDQTKFKGFSLPVSRMHATKCFPINLLYKIIESKRHLFSSQSLLVAQQQYLKKN